MGLVPSARRSKESVNYRQYEKCGNCIYFYGPNSCELVTGNISDEALCDLWAIRKPLSSFAKGAEFYQNELSKEQRNIERKF